MNVYDLGVKLKSERISRTLYSLDGGLPNEKICLDRENEKWIVYYSEIGERTGCVRFLRENEACQYIYDAIMDIVNGKAK